MVALLAVCGLIACVVARRRTKTQPKDDQVESARSWNGGVTNNYVSVSTRSPEGSEYGRVVATPTPEPNYDVIPANKPATASNYSIGTIESF